MAHNTQHTQHTTHRTQRIAHNTHWHTTHSTQRTTHSTQHKALSTQHTTRSTLSKDLTCTEAAKFQLHAICYGWWVAIVYTHPHGDRTRGSQSELALHYLTFLPYLTYLPYLQVHFQILRTSGSASRMLDCWNARMLEC